MYEWDLASITMQEHVPIIHAGANDYVNCVLIVPSSQTVWAGCANGYVHVWCCFQTELTFRCGSSEVQHLLQLCLDTQMR